MIEEARPTSQAADAEPLPEGEEAPPAGTRAMAIVRWSLVVLMAAVAGAAWIHYARATGAPAAAAAVYRCPMHPAIVQDRPGSCSICGMDLVAAQAGPGAAAGAGGRVEPAPPATPPAAGKYWCPMHPEVASDDPEARCPKCGGMKLLPREEPPAATRAADVPGLVPVDLSIERRQLMGMRTAKAVRRRLADTLRGVGFVSADEQRVAVVTARASGWIQELRVAQSGHRVRAGDVLLLEYSGEVVSAQVAYVNAVRWKENVAKTPNAGTIAAQNIDKDALRRLQLYGMARQDIEAVARRGEPIDAVPIRAPVTGVVARKSVLPGQFVAAGTELYQIADLSTVWVVAELPEQELGRVAVGQKARLRLAAYPGDSFEGKVDFVYPAVNPETRTLAARMAFRNPDLRLRPGMFGDVLIEAGGVEALVVPTEAVVDTGDLQYVFLARGEGRFEPRAVKPGARRDGQVEVLAGLSAGDEVVTTANFYLDAESRLRAAIEGHAAAGSTGATAR